MSENNEEGMNFLDPDKKMRVLKSLGIKQRSLHFDCDDADERSNDDVDNIMSNKEKINELSENMWNSMKINGGHWGILINIMNFFYSVRLI